MPSEEVKEKKSEQEILFPDIEVEGITVRPWSFGQLAYMGPTLHKIMLEAQKCGFTADDFSDKTKELDMIKVSSLIMLVSPFVPEMVSMTTGIKRTEVESWPPEKGVAVFLTILSQNADKLKNLYGLSARMTKAPKQTNG